MGQTQAASSKAETYTSDVEMARVLSSKFRYRGQPWPSF